MVLLRATTTAIHDLRFKVISERPVTLTFECRALGEGAVTTYFNVLGLSSLARAGLELMIHRMSTGARKNENAVQHNLKFPVSLSPCMCV
jgi:hypothetical protein